MAYPPTHLTALLLLPLLGSCAGTREAADATLRIHHPGGSELGVSTTYGVVFLGRTVTAGNIEVEAHFGDGLDLESSVVEPIGGGLYTAETDIRLPSVPMKFHVPKPGDELILRGRTPEGPWDAVVIVREDERIQGILIDSPQIMRNRNDQVGAGVYWRDPLDSTKEQLVGLVSARVQIDGQHFLAVMGPEYLWRIATHRRDLLRRKPWVYREDIM